MSRIGVLCVLCLCFVGGSLPASESNLVLVAVTPSSDGVELRVEYPGDFTNGLDVLVSSNLLSSRWTLLATNLPAMGIHPFTWMDPSAPVQGFRAYVIGNAGCDIDLDGIPDARETLVYGTNPRCADTDEDGVPDGAELGRGTNPSLGGDANLVLYADSDGGLDSYDGLAAVAGGGHGPKQSIGAVYAVAYSGDTIAVRGESVFTELAPCLGGKSVVLRPFGSVTVRP